MKFDFFFSVLAEIPIGGALSENYGSLAFQFTLA
jgi:hypothetical protein